MDPALQAIHAYYRIFSTLDLQAIAACYSEPCMSTSPAGVFTASTRAELAKALSATTEALKAKDYARSEFTDAEVLPLNSSATLIKGIAIRYLNSGAEMERVPISYLMHQRSGAPDWKIAVILLPA